MTRALAVAIGVALLVPGLAFAKPRVAIVAFAGDSQGTVQDVVVGALESEASLVGPRQVTRAIDKLGLDADMSAKQLKKLAKELEADVIIRGDLGKKGKHKLLHVRLFVNGKRVKGFKVEFGNAKSSKFKDALRDKLLAKLETDAKGEGEGEGVGPTEDLAKGKGNGKGGKKGKGDEVPDDVGGEVADADAKGKGKDGKKGKKGKDGEEGDDAAGDDSADAEAGNDDPDGKSTASADDDDDDDDPDTLNADADLSDRGTVSRTTRSMNNAAIRVNFGPSLSSRSLTYSSRAYEEAPKPYSNPAVPGARVEAEIYPLALAKPGTILAGLGFAGEYDKTLSLSVQSTLQMGTKFPVSQSWLSLGGRFRFLFGQKPTSASITVGGGYMSRTFSVDRAKLEPGNVIDLPDVGYKGYNAGLWVRFPIMQKIAVFAGGRGIFVTTTGSIQTNTQYGQAKVTGGEAALGVDVAIGKLMGVRVVAEATQMGFVFTGTGQMSNNRDGDPATKDVGGAADRYLGAAVLFSVVY